MENLLSALKKVVNKCLKTLQKTERKWKKDKLSISLAALKNFMSIYQVKIKDARNIHFSELLIIWGHHPKIPLKIY